MNQNLADYHAKKITVDDAISLVKSGDVITVGCGQSGPISIQRKLHQTAKWAKDLRVLSAMAVEPYPYLCDPQYRSVFQIDCIFTSAPERQAYESHQASYLPAHLNKAAVYWLANYKPNIFYGVATPMDKHGNFHLSPCLLVERDSLEQADLVVLEINPNHPVVYGDTVVNIRDVDYVVEVDTPMSSGPAVPRDERHEKIGAYIAELIHDGDTIQLGIGGIPDAVASQLIDKHDLGIHTEMITSTVATLAKAGVITGRKKTLHPGKIVGSFAVGDQNLYDFLDHNSSVVFYRPSYAIDPRVICQNDNMVSVNTALCCDLTGQVSSEAIGTRQYSGSGGQVSTASGASWAKNGRNIIAIRSTAKTKYGVVSNIKAVHDLGTVVTLSRNDVDYVVTEYGVAPLRGRSIRERVGNLIAVAHPDYRAELRRDAEKYHL